MSRRSGLLAAAGALLLGVVVAGPLLVRAPPSVALWLVNNHTGFFRQTYEAWSADKPLLTRLLVRGLAYKLSRDWVTQAERAVRATGMGTMEQTVLAARSELNTVFLNQRDVRHPPLDLSTYARLVYGLGWCDGQNHLMALLLGEFFDDVTTFALYDRATGLSPHSTVSIVQNGKRVYADAWSKVPLMVMDEDRDLVDASVPAWSAVVDDLIFERPLDIRDVPEDVFRAYYNEGNRRIVIRPQIFPLGIFDPWTPGRLDMEDITDDDVLRVYRRKELSDFSRL